MLCDTHHLKTILSKTTVGWEKKMGEGNEDEIGMEMKVKMKSEEWKMRMKLWMNSERKISVKGDKWKR